MNDLSALFAQLSKKSLTLPKSIQKLIPTTTIPLATALFCPVVIMSKIMRCDWSDQARRPNRRPCVAWLNAPAEQNYVLQLGYVRFLG